MNVENMTKLRDHLVWLRDNERRDKFCMGAWIDHPACSGFGHGVTSIGELEAEIGGDHVISPFECQTVACLAGHAALLGGARADDDIEEFAALWLGLSTRSGFYLFHGKWIDRRLDDITIDEAIDHLTSMLAQEQAR